MKITSKLLCCVSLSVLIACGETSLPPVAATPDEHGHDHDDDNDNHSQLHLSETQIQAAGIKLAPVTTGIGGALTLPALLIADPARSASISATLPGRVQQLSAAIGMQVKAGAVLAVLDSPQAAELGATLQAAQQQVQLARANLEREERLFAEQVSPRVDVLAARTAAAEAEIALQLARQQAGSSGADAAPSRLLSIRAPMSGHITMRKTQVGAQVERGDELFQIADLSHLALELAVPPERAAEIEPGSPISLRAGTRTAQGRLSVLSPMIDPMTRQVPAIGLVPNPDGRWRIGETVSVSVPLGSGSPILAVPQAAVQMVEGTPSVFVRNAEGFKITPVTTGDQAGDLITVLSALPADAQIAVRNSFVLKAEAEKGEGEHAH